MRIYGGGGLGTKATAFFLIFFRHFRCFRMPSSAYGVSTDMPASYEVGLEGFYEPAAASHAAVIRL